SRHPLAGAFPAPIFAALFPPRLGVAGVLGDDHDHPHLEFLLGILVLILVEVLILVLVRRVCVVLPGGGLGLLLGGQRDPDELVGRQRFEAGLVAGEIFVLALELRQLGGGILLDVAL